jgi:hypothetical protein
MMGRTHDRSDAAGWCGLMQELEPRQFLSGGPGGASVAAAAGTGVIVGRNVNVSEWPANQAEATIAINRRNPDQLFAASNMEEFGERTPDYERSLFTASSFDGGRTWERRIIATADGAGGLPQAEGDPSAAYDAHGNLFFAYLMATEEDDTNRVAITVSRDNGRTFRLLEIFEGDLDMPTVTTGANSVWLSFKNYESSGDDEGGVEIAGAPISSAGRVGAFSVRERVAGSDFGNYADLAVGPRGQVIVTYQDPEDFETAGGIFVATDPDGLGPRPVSAPRLTTATNVGGFDFIPAQNNRSIDAEPGVVFDRSGGKFDGRAYLVYTDERVDESNDTEILLRYSDDNGRTWSAPVRVNDDRTANSQFLPRMQIDQTTGQLAIVWHDARSDLGVPGKGSTNAVPNDDAQFWGTLVTPTKKGLQVGRNFRISAGTSNADAAQNRIDYGDYTGVDFYRGVIHPVWADNSNSTGNNPDGTLRAMDVYTARIRVTAFDDRHGNGHGRDWDDVEKWLKKLLGHR